MTDEPLDPLDDLAAYADHLGFELDTSELEPEPLPDFDGEAFAMPDDEDGWIYDAEPDPAFSQAQQQADNDLDGLYVELQQQLGRPLTAREQEHMAAGMQEQYERGHHLDPRAAYFDSMYAAGQEPVVLDDNASVQDMAKWATERYGDLSAPEVTVPSQQEVDAVAEAAEGFGPEAHQARTQIAKWQMDGVVGMRGD